MAELGKLLDESVRRSKTMNDTDYREALRILCERDLDLKGVADRYGIPIMRVREPGFPTLVRIIIEQQVSLASARAVYDRLINAWDPPEAESLLKLSDDDFRGMGFSRQKILYVRTAAAAIMRGEIDLKAFNGRPDQAVRDSLMKLKGIGRWTADIYLMMALRRPDIWPGKDLAIIKAVQAVKGLGASPSADELKRISDTWRPYRSAAAMLLWHHYLTEKGKIS